MAALTAHPPGVFCWPELATTDPHAAARFYATLFDWSPVATGSAETPYTVFQIDDESVSAVRGLSPLAGPLPRWNSHVSVANADETAEHAAALGGTILTPPSDGRAGRFSAIEDPMGAVFYVWQAMGEIGAERLNEPGSLCWTELISWDIEAAEGFYTTLFGWSSRRDRAGDYVEFLRGRDPVAGMLRTPPGRGAEGSHWLPYFAVADVDDAVQLARRQFAKILGRPMDIPMVGRSAVLRDPQGATFGIFGVNEAA